jgi:predicted MFS family arabinose efflux permease
MLTAAMRQTGIDEVYASSLISAEFAAFMVGALLIMNSPRYWPRLVAVSACLVYAFGGALAALAHSADVLLVARVSCGASGGAMMAISMRVISSHHNFERVFAVSIVGATLWNAVLLFAVPAALTSFGPPAAYLALALVALSALPAMFWLVSGERTECPDKKIVGAFGAVMLSAYFLSRLNDATAWQFTERLGARAGVGELGVGAILALAGVVALLAPFVVLRLERWQRPALSVLVVMTCKASQALTVYYLPFPVAFALSQILALFAFVMLTQFFLTAFADADASGHLATLGGIAAMAADATGPFLAGQVFHAASYAGVTHLAFVSGLAGAIMGFYALRTKGEKRPL